MVGERHNVIHNWNMEGILLEAKGKHDLLNFIGNFHHI